MTENIILKKVLTDSKYFSNVISNLEEDDFDSKSDKYILRNINNIYSKYNKAPSLDELILYVDSDNLKTTEKIVLRDRLNEIKNTEIDIKEEILIDYTEKWVKSARVENILLLGADMLDGKGKETLGSIQQRMEDINKLTFKKSAGLDYKKDAMKNFLEYTQVDEGGIKSSLEIINIATGGGTKQGLHLVMAQSNSAKTTLLCNIAIDALKEGKNVVFITMEESELDIRERIDANLLDMRTEELRKAGTTLSTPFQHLMNNSMGDLKIKSYGPMAANCIDYKSQLDDWRVKDNFIPDLIVHDSITITAPNSKNTEGLYSVGKSVSEELKALGVHYDIPVWSAVQTGRQAYGASSLDMESVSSSISIMQVATTVIGLSLDEHRPDVRILNIVKSRKMNKAKQKSCVVNIDTDKQRVWDIADNGYNEDNKTIQYYNNLNNIAEKVEQGEITVHQLNTNSSSILDSLLSR